MNPNFPDKWVDDTDLRKCVGRTISKVELVSLPFGCTWSSAWAVAFTDGTRAWFAGRPNTGCVGPDLQEITGSAIFTPEEVGELAAYLSREKVRHDRETRKRKERELRRLQEELKNA